MKLLPKQKRGGPIPTYRKGGTSVKTKYGSYNSKSNIIILDGKQFDVSNPESVGQIQTYLNKKGFNLNVDKKYGLQTIRSVNLYVNYGKPQSTLLKPKLQKTTNSALHRDITYRTTSGSGYVQPITESLANWVDVTIGGDYEVPDEIRNLNSLLIRNLRRAYNLSDGTTIDNDLMRALVADKYKKYSGFTLNNNGVYDCARYVNDQTGLRGRRPYGNAWDVGELNGGQELFNLYRDKASIFRDTSKDLKILTETALKGWTPNIKKLRVGDYVTMYYKHSGLHNDSQHRTGAYKGYSGLNYNTHVGVVVGYDRKGNPVISHNIHGKVYNESIQSDGAVRWGHIVGAYRMRR